MDGPRYSTVRVRMMDGIIVTVSLKLITSRFEEQRHSGYFVSCCFKSYIVFSKSMFLTFSLK